MSYNIVSYKYNVFVYFVSYYIQDTFICCRINTMYIVYLVCYHIQDTFICCRINTMYIVNLVCYHIKDTRLA